MEVNFDWSGVEYCSMCRGTGVLKAMQMGVRKNNGEKRVERVEDATVKCSFCKGLGIVKNR